jgi:glycosyltransferase involved in cell wall biosynthesis
MSVYKNDTLEYLKVAVNSILKQSYNDFKFFIIQDGPVHDEVGNYLNHIDDPRVALRIRKANKGLAVSLNELLSEVLPMDDCYFVARMDADDYSVVNRFDVQLNYLNNNPDVDIVGSYISESSDPLTEEGHIVKFPETHQSCRSLFGRRHPVAHPSVMFRRSFFDKAGVYPTDTLRDEDGMLWLQGFLSGCRFANVPKILVHMRVSDSFYQRRNSKEKIKLDYQNRVRIINELDLPRINYLFAYARYILFRFASPIILRFAYRIR